MDKIEELLTRGVERIFPSKEGLERVLRSGKKLRLYQGFDPSMPNLHLGNLVGIHKLRQFQELGHEVIFLVGDFTGMIGDPTDKSATRTKLSREQTVANSQNWKEQAKKIISFEGANAAKIKFNSEWLDKISFKKLIEISSNFTAQQMLERDFFQKRLSEGKPIHLHEFLYPIAVAIDCVEMDVDLEIGGNDQTFNMLAGRTLMQSIKGKEKFVLSTKLLVDSAGNKVGKTTGNALFLNALPHDLYGGIMAFPDEVVSLSFELLTSLPLDQIPKEGHPMEIKKQLAHEIVLELHSRVEADKASEEWQKFHQENDLSKIQLPEISYTSLKTTSSGATIAGTLTTLGYSMTQLKNTVNAGSVDINNVTIKDRSHPVNSGDIIKVGDKVAIRIVK